MKEELITKLRDLLQTEDVAAVQNDLNEIQSAYNEETQKERQQQETAWAESNKEEEASAAFEFNPNPLDAQFDELTAGFEQKISAVAAEVPAAEDVVDASTEDAETTTEAVTEAATEVAETATETVSEAASEGAETATETVTEAATEVVETATETATETASEAIETVTETVAEQAPETPVPPAVAEEVSDAAGTVTEGVAEATEEVSAKAEEVATEAAAPITETTEAADAEEQESEAAPEAATEAGAPPEVPAESAEQSAESHAEEFAAEESAPAEKPELKLDSKENIMATMEALLAMGSVAAIKGDVRTLRGAWNDLTKKDRNEQFEAWKEANKEVEDPESFEENKNPLDEKFDALNDTFRKQFDAQMETVRAEQHGRMEQKKAMIAKLQELIQNEENIGAAFSSFNTINDQWKTVPFVPTDAGRELQDEFFRLRDDFFYNIRIYKALQENDLQINERKKLALLLKAKELSSIEDIRELDRLVRAYQAEWMDVGPSPRETYKEQGDEFFSLCREAIGRIRAHYDERNALLEANVAGKLELIEKVRQVSVLDITNHGTWTKKTQTILDLQKEWKTGGAVPRDKSEKLWKEFRGVCDNFFQAKQAFYDKRKGEQEEHKTAKFKLVERAKELQESDKWKETTDQLIALQKEWKAIGPAPQRDEQKLWQKFRAACDTFFTNKKKHFEGMDSQQGDNLKLKQELIAEIKKAEITGDRSKDVGMLKEFSVRFNAIGYVPRKDVKSIYDEYNAALDEKYKKLNLDSSEKAMFSYQQRIDNLRSDNNSDGQLRREKFALRDKIERLQSTVRQYQNNMEFFKGDGAIAMRKDYEKKIDKAEREISEIRSKLKMIDS